jgi:ligand-binding SRPBCC domain-containing protein
MKLYTLHEAAVLQTSIEKAWNFFSSPANLPVITPPELQFRIVSEVPAEAYAGLILQYTVRPFPGLRVKWVSEITHVEKHRFFVDEQRFGPYRFWHHEHHFKETDAGVEMIDLVHYALHADPLSRPVHALLVRPQLERIFSFRREALKKFFP